MGGKVWCPCGAQVYVPEGGQYVPCPSCKRMVSLAEPRRRTPSAQASTPRRPPQPPPAPKPEAPAGECLCPRCGSPRESADSPCVLCGFPYGAPSQQAEAAPRKSLWGLKLLLLFSAAAVILGVAVSGLLRPRKKPPEPPARPGGYLYRVVTTPRMVSEQLSLSMAKKCIMDFQVMEGRFPKDLQELAQRGVDVPPPPQGYEYVYDPKTGQISLNRVEPTPPAPPGP